MKNLLKAALLSLVFSAPVYVDFSGDFAFGLWTQVLNGGSIVDGGVGSVSLTSSDGGGGASFTDFTITALSDLTVTFDWDYLTSDTDGPHWDPFGYLLNGAFTQLTVNTGLDAQNGTASFFVLTGDVFGFRAWSRDSIFGSATTSVTGFSAVPLPSSLSLLSCAFRGVVLVQRRRRENEKTEAAEV